MSLSPPPSSPPLIYNNQLRDPLLMVFSYLDVKDLCTLSQVSKRMHEDIADHCRTTCKCLRVESALKRRLNEQLALKKDTDTLQLLQTGNYSYKWLLLKWVKQRRTYRKSVAEFNMAHTENPSYIRKEYDDKLAREIVGIVKLRWIYFTHQFTNIQPGSYRAVLRMGIVDVSWVDHYASATIKIFWEDTQGTNHEKKTEVKAHEWKGIFETLKTLDEGKCISLRGASLCNYDSDTGWFDLCLEIFDVTEESDVTFEFKDILNFWWVSGMRWDYVELRPVDWMNYKPIAL